ncbi:hypothetical protein SEA_BUTTON_67 [Gordonia phage Button]|nr:hypothetical protein SEA_BUTTON_67 [Gordonia phage Button]WKW84862.1 hypothetical protein SEA_JAMZY_71 [Gordonia phage Jamzy]
MSDDAATLTRQLSVHVAGIGVVAVSDIEIPFDVDVNDDGQIVVKAASGACKYIAPILRSIAEAFENCDCEEEDSAGQEEG